MPLAANAVMAFTSYTVEDGGIRLAFVCSNPGPGEVTDYNVFLTDAEINATANLAALKTAVTTKLQRRYRAATVAAKLDPLLGQTITI